VLVGSKVDGLNVERGDERQSYKGGEGRDGEERKCM
jgi:hypothetical protein